MTKKYNVVSIEDYHVVIDDREIPYNPKGGTNGNFLCLHEIERSPEDALVTNVGNCTGCREIVATIGKRIDSLPLIEIPDEVDKFIELENTLLECSRGIIMDKNVFSAERNASRYEKSLLKIEWLKELGLWPIELKAATKTYTEEDIRAAYQEGAFDMMEIHNDNISSKQLWMKNGKRILNSLKKPIIAVELELKCKFHKEGSSCDLNNKCTYPNCLKLDENNIIHPVNVFYE